MYNQENVIEVTLCNFWIYVISNHAAPFHWLALQGKSCFKESQLQGKLQGKSCFKESQPPCKKFDYPKISIGEGNGTPLQYSCLENPMDGGAWKAAVHGVAKSRTRLSNFTFTFHFHALEKEMATHSSVLAWRIPGTEEPGGLLSMGSHRVRHDWSDLAAAAAARSPCSQKTQCGWWKDYRGKEWWKKTTPSCSNHCHLDASHMLVKKLS